MRVCIFGGGSVGIHYARAWSKLGAEVRVFDLSKDAIGRFPNIWTERYGSTVPGSVQVASLNEFLESELEFDLVVIGTPPPSHGELARLCLDKKTSKFISIQKPVCTPDSKDLSNFFRIEEDASTLGVNLISGYNHRYAASFREFLSFVDRQNDRHAAVSIEVNWLESWEGILRAHPWLDSPSDSYLGHSGLGGGALFEHSHGLDICLYLWNYLGGLGLNEVAVETMWSGSGSYDVSTVLSGSSSDGRLSFRVAQNVDTNPAEKSVRITSDGWAAVLDFSSSQDTIHLSSSKEDISKKFSKNRESDFDSEVSLVKSLIEGDQGLSLESRMLLDFARALDTSIFAASALHKEKSNHEYSQELLRTWARRVESSTRLG